MTIEKKRTNGEPILRDLELTTVGPEVLLSPQRSLYVCLNLNSNTAALFVQSFMLHAIEGGGKSSTVPVGVLSASVVPEMYL